MRTIFESLLNPPKGTEASRLLKEGDVILAVDGEPATKFMDIMKNVGEDRLQLVSRSVPCMRHASSL